MKCFQLSVAVSAWETWVNQWVGLGEKNHGRRKSIFMGDLLHNPKRLSIKHMVGYVGIMLKLFLARIVVFYLSISASISLHFSSLSIAISDRSGWGAANVRNRSPINQAPPQREKNGVVFAVKRWALVLLNFSTSSAHRHTKVGRKILQYMYFNSCKLGFMTFSRNKMPDRWSQKLVFKNENYLQKILR